MKKFDLINILLFLEHRLKKIKTRKIEHVTEEKNLKIKATNESNIEEPKLKTYKRNHHHPKNMITRLDKNEKIKEHSLQALGASSSAKLNYCFFMKIAQLIFLLFYTYI